MTDLDRTLIESTRTHRQRLAASFVFGRQDQRRRVRSNSKRLVGSIVIAAVACAACIGTAFVLNFLERQRQENAIRDFQAAMASNPLQPTDEMPEDEETGFLVNLETGDLIDPRTGFTVDRDTLLATDPNGETLDPRIGWYYDPISGNYTSPSTRITIDPDTLKVVEE